MFAAALGLIMTATPSIDVAVGQLCDARLAPREFCETFTTCAPGKKSACAGDNHKTVQADEDWSEWSCDVDRKNGYLECTQKTHLTTGPGAGDVFDSRWQAALFVSKGRITVGLSTLGDRPQAAFFSPDGQTWSKVDPLPKLSAATFALKEPRPPKKDADHFQAEFFVELTLPREGTTISAEGRWVNTFRDDSGYGQRDTQLSTASVLLDWNATTGKFSVNRQ
ncbi:MAG: hypothetical protein GQE15_24590 [Archangiaceae bacterium]|nr:hypothetical protein [Archangiaceae bacterium]